MQQRHQVLNPAGGSNWANTRPLQRDLVNPDGLLWAGIKGKAQSALKLWAGRYTGRYR